MKLIIPFFTNVSSMEEKGIENRLKIKTNEKRTKREKLEQYKKKLKD